MLHPRILESSPVKHSCGLFTLRLKDWTRLRFLANLYMARPVPQVPSCASSSCNYPTNISSTSSTGNSFLQSQRCVIFGARILGAISEVRVGVLVQIETVDPFIPPREGDRVCTNRFCSHILQGFRLASLCFRKQLPAAMHGACHLDVERDPQGLGI